MRFFSPRNKTLLNRNFSAYLHSGKCWVSPLRHAILHSSTPPPPQHSVGLPFLARVRPSIHGGVSVVRRVLGAVVAAVGFAGTVESASAAELRISLAELAGVVQAVIGDAKVHLNNKPGGLLNFSSGSYAQVAGQQIDVPLAPKSFEVLGSTYAYYVNDLNSNSSKLRPCRPRCGSHSASRARALSWSPAASRAAVRLPTHFRSSDWNNGTVSIDVVPVRYGTSMALQVKSVSIGGTMQAKLRQLRRILLRRGLRAGVAVGQPRNLETSADLAAMLKDKVNDPQIQAGVATNIKKHLALGSAGEITITNVVTDAKGVTITFAMPGAVGG